MEKLRTFTLSQVAQHKSKQDCWLIIGGRVVDVTKFLEEHPGGEEVLLESSGKDATTDFDYIGHSNKAKTMLLEYQIGYLQGDHHHIHQQDSGDARFPITNSNSLSNSILLSANGGTDGRTGQSGPPPPYKEPNPNGSMKAFAIKEDPKLKYATFMELFTPIIVIISFLAYNYLSKPSH